MGDLPPGSVTRLLAAVSQGRQSAQEQLWTLVYDELRSLARRQMAQEAPGQTLQSTALVHEAYLRLLGNEEIHWENRRHFFGAAAQAMRRIRVDRARNRKSVKRGGRRERVSLKRAEPVLDRDQDEILAIDEALTALQRINPESAEIVKLRYFADLSVKQTAAVLGVSPRTIDNRWYYARAWMHRQLSQGGTSGPEEVPSHAG